MDKLTEIMAWKRQEVEARIRPIKAAEFERWRNTPGRPSFARALQRESGLAVISEIKRKSPSAGAIAEGVDSVEQARKYYNAGTDAISVLTDEKFFGGSIKDLWEVNDLLGNRDDTPPTLRKDFFVHPIQVLEAAEAGASAILIIVRALADDDMRVLYEVATQAGLDALFEIHNMHDLDRALEANASIIGVNNRDLSRFVTDLSISEELIPEFPSDVTAVSESGIWTVEDGERVHAAGADAVLIGEALMRMDEPERFISSLHDI